MLLNNAIIMLAMPTPWIKNHYYVKEVELLTFEKRTEAPNKSQPTRPKVLAKCKLLKQQRETKEGHNNKVNQDECTLTNFLY